MDIGTILLAIAGIGILLMAIGIVIDMSAKKDPANMFRRSQNLMAVHSSDGTVRYQSYNPKRGKPMQTVGDINITHFTNAQFNNAVMKIAAYGDGDSVGISAEAQKPVEPAKEITIHKPGDRFLDIIGE